MKTPQQIRDRIRYLESKQASFEEIINNSAELDIEKVVIYAQNSAVVRALKEVVEE